jgi:hypothetical protein
MFMHSLNSILRAGWCISAAWRNERRNTVTVQINGQQHDMSEDFFQLKKIIIFRKSWKALLPFYDLKYRNPSQHQQHN